jgi:hypothetical protein
MTKRRCASRTLDHPALVQTQSRVQRQEVRDAVRRIKRRNSPSRTGSELCWRAMSDRTFRSERVSGSLVVPTGNRCQTRNASNRIRS